MYAIFLHTADVQQLMNVSDKVALQYVKDIVAEFGIDASRRPRSQKITIREYSDYFGLDYVDVINALRGLKLDYRQQKINKAMASLPANSENNQQQQNTVER